MSVPLGSKALKPGANITNLLISTGLQPGAIRTSKFLVTVLTVYYIWLKTYVVQRVAATESSRWMVMRYPLTHFVILSPSFYSRVNCAKNLSYYPLPANPFRHYPLPIDIDSRHPRIRWAPAFCPP